MRETNMWRSAVAKWLESMAEWRRFYLSDAAKYPYANATHKADLTHWGIAHGACRTCRELCKPLP